MRTISARPLLDAESRVTDADHLSVRLWLRLLTCTMMIERHVREQLRDRFDITLARFDMMAQLARAPKGLRMTEISRRLMVTGGNVTGLTDQLVGEGLVVRRDSPGDGRVCTVSLTTKGRRQFEAMVAEHDRWIVDVLTVGPDGEREMLFHLLGGLKAGVAQSLAARRTPSR